MYFCRCLHVLFRESVYVKIKQIICQPNAHLVVISKTNAFSLRIGHTTRATGDLDRKFGTVHRIHGGNSDAKQSRKRASGGCECNDSRQTGC